MREVPFDVTAAEPDLGGDEIEVLGMEVAFEEADGEPDVCAEGLDDVPLVAVVAADADLGGDEMEGEEVPFVVAALPDSGAVPLIEL